MTVDFPPTFEQALRPRARKSRWVILVCFAAIFVAIYSVFSQVYWPATDYSGKSFIVNKGESAGALAVRLKKENIIGNDWLFQKYVVLRGIDKKIQAGHYTVNGEVSIASVAAALSTPQGKQERTITIIPGWDFRDIADYLETQGIGTAKDFYTAVGEPAFMYNPPQAATTMNIAPVFASNAEVLRDRPLAISYEGYLAPDTFRIYSDASLANVIKKMIDERDLQFTPEMYEAIKKSGHSVHEILTLASIVEREVQSEDDKAKVADLFWRRLSKNWALQADSTVHYATGKKGDVFTTGNERDGDNLWNTYKYPGLPPGPICSPSLESIMAVINPEKNDAWYFLTTPEGEVKYGKTLDEHNWNVAKFLR